MEMGPGLRGGWGAGEGHLPAAAREQREHRGHAGGG